MTAFSTESECWQWAGKVVDHVSSLHKKKDEEIGLKEHFPMTEEDRTEVCHIIVKMVQDGERGDITELVHKLVAERECRQWATTAVDRVVKIYQERCLPNKPNVEVMTVEEKSEVCNKLVKIARSDTDHSNINSFLENLVQDAATRCGNPPLRPSYRLRGVPAFFIP